MKRFLILMCFGVQIFAEAGTPALPEPGVVMYGNVRSTTGVLLPISAASIQVTEQGAGSVNLNLSSNPPIRVVTINGIAYYVTRIPFVTRVVGTGTGQIIFDLPGNTFEIKASGPTYTRQASFNGVVATFESSAQQSFTINAAQRGRFEQVDFRISQPTGPSYSNWAQNNFPNPAAAEAQPSADYDKDGVSNADEFAAGTDPKDPNSFFKTNSVQLTPGGGFQFSWKSVPGKQYQVERSVEGNLQTWVTVGVVNATDVTTQYLDTPPAGLKAVNYRIRTFN